MLSGETVTFGKNFFDATDSLLANERSLSGGGITFHQSKAMMNALFKISEAGGLPGKLMSRTTDKLLKEILQLSEKDVTPENVLKMNQALRALVDHLKTAPVPVTTPASTYNEVRSILGQAAADTSNNREARILRNVQNLFDQAADASLPMEKVQRLQLVRKQWEA